MANPLTGEFDAVLQVSGSTVNRLLATLHQNAFTKPELPSFPHSVELHLGYPRAFEGVYGRLSAQVGVPRVTLRHQATDRFLLEVGVRAWFRPDHGSSAFPAFIHGTLRAEYRVHDIDPGCRGWRGRAADYLWVRVVPDSVRFEGSALDDVLLQPSLALVGDAAADAAAEAARVAKVTRQASALLATDFEATPHPVGAGFRKGSLVSLAVPGSGSAVALPIALDGGRPAGNIASIQHVLLGGADLAVGVSVQAILALAQPALDSVKAFSATVGIHISTPWPAPDIDTVYRAGVHPPTIAWLPQGSHAVLKIKTTGWAKTNSVLADATFDVEQDIILNFDSGAGRLWLAEGSHVVTVRSSGLGSGTVASEVKKAVVASLKAIVSAACAQGQPGLDRMTNGTATLSQQLRTLDATASASIDGAEFLPDGLILRGPIALAPRPRPVVASAVMPEQDAHSALQSWIPGGRVDRFEWTWTWTATQETGRAVHDDRFLLRRPRGRSGQWGISLGLREPLPGLDGWGQVCLVISGVQVDPVTGEFVPVRSVRRCHRFGFSIGTVVEAGGRLYLRDMPELSKDVPFPQLALVDVAGRRGTPAGANTLVVYAGEGWDRETAATLARGLEGSGRFDAGLQLLVLFREDVVRSTASPLIRDVQSFAAEAGIAAHVNEDVGRSWSRAFGFQGDRAWRLLDPNGVVAWSHDGPLAPDVLAGALARQLTPAHGPTFPPRSPRFDVGSQVSAAALHLAPDDIVQAPCPPFPLTRMPEGAVVAFVSRGAAVSVAQLRHLASQHADGAGPVVVAVVDGATARDVDEMTKELGVHVMAIADPAGTLTDRFDVKVWPTTLVLDSVGRVTDVRHGVDRERDTSGG